MQSEQPEDDVAAKKTSDRVTPARLGGARADFVASLGRKAHDARAALTTLESERGSAAEKAPREDLKRRLHALGASARLLHFEAMATALGDAERLLEEAALTEAHLATVATVLADLPTLAWDEVTKAAAGDDAPEAPSARPEPTSAAPAASTASAGPVSAGILSAGPASTGAVSSVTLEAGTATAVLRSALVVGPAALEGALGRGATSRRGPLFECERTGDAQAAIEMARRLVPDVLLVDADVDAAAELVEALLDDPQSEPLAIVVLGTFREAEEAARFVALGVTRVLTKPIAPEAIRRACREAIAEKRGMTARVALGEPTLEQLGDRLADEVRRALVEGADGAARTCVVPLGEGTEVMSALWGAIARVRELVTARTNGAVRFGRGPEGAVALAPWLHPDLPGTHRASASLSARGRGPAADVQLHGRRVIVADDDPGVTWFIADLLRSAGCVVHEAMNGAVALDLAYRISPELVVSDILMPELDGFALARSLRRDVALRDTPVILLSWKEDLLQRVRELGANAAAYMRKESDSRAILARVREVLRPRARVEARLKAEGEVLGRLDGLTVRSLLELACELRPAARVSVRDASFLYEVELREGAPRRARRTDADGGVERGERVLAAMLGVGAGRFRVEPVVATGVTLDEAELEGTLAEQLARPLRMARAATNATSGAQTLLVEHVTIDAQALAGYVATTPEPTRAIVLALLDGASPRAMLLGGGAEPTLLEDVLRDLAARGAIIGVRGAHGEDLLAAAFDALAAARPLASSRSSFAAAPRAPSSRPIVEAPAEELPALVAARTPSGAFVAADALAPHPPPSARPEDPMPSSLTDAVMREVGGHSPDIRERSSHPPPIVEPSELRMRSSSPPADPDRELPSLPLDAIVPASAGGETPSPGAIELMIGDPDAKDDGRTPITALERTDLDAPVAAYEHSVPLLFEDSGPLTPAPRVPRGRAGRAAASEDAEAHRTPLAAVASRPLPPEPKRSRAPYIVALGTALVVALLAFKLTSPTDHGEAAAGAPSAEPAAPLSTGVPVPSDPSGVTYGDLPPGIEVPPGQGLLELTAEVEASVRIDGIARGAGPKLRAPLSAGPHEVQVRVGEDHAPTSRVVEVRAGHIASMDLRGQ